MTFNANIPQSTDLISNSQADLLANNQFLGDTTGAVANGYYNLPNGLIIQWGSATVSNGSSGTKISFNVPFATAVYSIQMTIQKNTSTGQGGSARSVFVNPGSETTTAFTAKLVSGDATNPVYWFAIGL